MTTNVARHQPVSVTRAHHACRRDGGKRFVLRPPAGVSDPSGAPVAYLDFGAVDDDRDRSIPLRSLQHFGEERPVLEDVEVLDLEAVLRVGLTGRGGVGSRVLAEDSHGFGHWRGPPMRDRSTASRSDQRTGT